jgi:hypothetical protein
MSSPDKRTEKRERIGRLMRDQRSVKKEEGGAVVVEVGWAEGRRRGKGRTEGEGQGGVCVVCGKIIWQGGVRVCVGGKFGCVYPCSGAFESGSHQACLKAMKTDGKTTRGVKGKSAGSCPLKSVKLFKDYNRVYSIAEFDPA